MGDPAKSNPQPPVQPKHSEKAAEKPEATSAVPPAPANQGTLNTKVYGSSWPLILTSVGSLIVALIAYNFQLIIAESGIAWWHEKPAAPLHELHLKPNEIHGRIGLRNLTGKVFRNVGIELKVSRGEFDRGVFEPDVRDVISEAESRATNTLETGPRGAPFVLRQHTERFDPSRTWFFDYSGTDLGDVSPALTEGVARKDFLELQHPVRVTTSESKEALPIDLHYWGWKDQLLEYKTAVALFAFVICLFFAIMLLVRWLKR